MAQCRANINDFVRGCGPTEQGHRLIILLKFRHLQRQEKLRSLCSELRGMGNPRKNQNWIASPQK